MNKYSGCVALVVRLYCYHTGFSMACLFSSPQELPNALLLKALWRSLLALAPKHHFTIDGLVLRGEVDRGSSSGKEPGASGSAGERKRDR